MNQTPLAQPQSPYPPTPQPLSLFQIWIWIETHKGEKVQDSRARSVWNPGHMDMHILSKTCHSYNNDMNSIKIMFVPFWH